MVVVWKLERYGFHALPRAGLLRFARCVFPPPHRRRARRFSNPVLRAKAAVLRLLRQPERRE